MDDLLYRLGLRQRTRRERMMDAVSERAHVLTKTMDSLIGESQQGAPKITKTVRQGVRRAEQDMGEAMGEAREETMERIKPIRQRGANVAQDAARRASAQKAALVAALGGLAANWNELSERMGGGVRERMPRRPVIRKEKQPQKKEKAYPGFWLWMLRLGLAFWFAESLRSRDIRDYVDYQAGQEMRQASEEHPIAWYKDWLDNLMIPNASLFAIVTVALEALTTLWYLTGRKRRLAALMGMMLSANHMLLHYKDKEKRNQSILALLAQSLLLRTGG